MRVAMYNSQQVIQRDWFKWGFCVLLGVILLYKDVNLSFRVGAPLSERAITVEKIADEPPSATQTSLKTEVVTEKTVEKLTEKVNQKPVRKAVIPKDNKANHFYNVTFLLNPTYAKRKNVDPAIVAAKNQVCYDYIKRFSPVAKAEMKKFGIPASITLAQGLLESDAGGSRLARKANNHFGIKCFSKSCRKGHCLNFTDDSHKDFFRNYNNVWESYRAHSLFVQRKRYAHLLDLKPSDYKGWAKGLSKAGYATDKRYADKLIDLIEILKLHQYDKY